jgi:uncharacterized membrane protein
MPDHERTHLFVLGYRDRAQAEAAVTELGELGRDQFLKIADHAVVSRDADGRVTASESKAADVAARRGGVAGGLAGALIAIATGPIGLGAIAVGAGIGAVTAGIRDRGFKDPDIRDVAGLMAAGRSVLIVAVEDPTMADRLRSVLDDIPELRASDRRWEVELAPDSKNVLRDAIRAYRRDHPVSAAPPT